MHDHAQESSCPCVISESNSSPAFAWASGALIFKMVSIARAKKI